LGLKRVPAGIQGNEMEAAGRIRDCPHGFAFLVL